MEPSGQRNHNFIVNTDEFKMIWEVCEVLETLQTETASQCEDFVYQPNSHAGVFLVALTKTIQ